MKHILLAASQNKAKFVKSVAGELAKESILVKTHLKTDDKPLIAQAFEISKRKPDCVFDISLEEFRKKTPNHQRGIMIYCQQANMEKTIQYAEIMKNAILDAADRAGYKFFAFEPRGEYMAQPYKGGFIKLVSDISEMHSRFMALLRASGLIRPKLELKEKEIAQEIQNYLSGKHNSFSLKDFLEKTISEKVGLDNMRTKVIPLLQFFSKQVESHMFLNIPISPKNTAEKIPATGIWLATHDKDDLAIFKTGLAEGIKQIYTISY